MLQTPDLRSSVTVGYDLDNGAFLAVAPEQLCSGTYILGVQGVGKSTLLEQIACQLLEQGESLIVFDPHGQLIDNIVRRMPGSRLDDTFHLDLKDREYPFALNVFACADPEDEEERDRTRNQVMHAFEKLWPETQRGVYFKKLLRHVIILLIEHPGLTLADVPRLLRDAAYRASYTDALRNVGSRDFWRFDYDALTPARQFTEATPLLTRVDELLAEPVIERILCQPRSTIDIRALIAARKNLFVTLPINEDAYAKAAGLVGVLLMSLVYAATFSFAEVPEAQRPGFGLIVDEFQNFATDEYAKLFSQGRKFRVKQFLAHQYRAQLEEAAADANRDATLSAFTKVIFRLTEPDSRALGSLFGDLEERRQPTNLAIEVLDKLERHPNPVVKEFAAKYVWPLQAGAKDRVGTRKRFVGRYYGQRNIPLRENEPGELDYATWCKYTLYYSDGTIWDSKTPEEKAAAYRRVNAPREGFDYHMVPDYPKRDFGAGEVAFIPAVAEEALQVLNLLLYEAQKNGIGCCAVKNAETELTSAQYSHYKENRNKSYKLDELLARMLRFDDWHWLEAVGAVDTEQYRQLVVDTMQGEQPENGVDAFARFLQWRQELEAVVDALVREPITQGPSGVRPGDVAMNLQRLPPRHAYVRIGIEAHAMATPELAPGVDADEERRRRAQLRDQTRRHLCRRVATMRPQPADGGGIGDVPPPGAGQLIPQETMPAADAPRLRRFRPLP